jgi:flagellar basal-body rod modification protein FlgD
MDSTQFTQQLVQMTSVEQQLLTNDLLEKVIQNTGSGIQTAISLLGREVTAAGDQTTIRGGQAQWSYDLADDAVSAKLEVVDASGATLHSTTIGDEDELRAGQHSFTWNGKDLSGKQLPDGGPYTLRITATDADLQTVETTTRIQGVVTGVEQADGKTLITVNGVKLPWEKVTSVAQADSEAETNNPDAKTPSTEAA